MRRFAFIPDDVPLNKRILRSDEENTHMELAGASLRERTTEALVVGVVFLGVGYIQNDVEWTTVFLGPVLFFVFRLFLDGVWMEIHG